MPSGCRVCKVPSLQVPSLRGAKVSDCPVFVITHGAGNVAVAMGDIASSTLPLF